jgi:hypothetical protein
MDVIRLRFSTKLRRELIQRETRNNGRNGRNDNGRYGGIKFSHSLFASS